MFEAFYRKIFQIDAWLDVRCNSQFLKQFGKRIEKQNFEFNKKALLTWRKNAFGLGDQLELEISRI